MLDQKEEGFLKNFVRDAMPRFHQAATPTPQASLDIDALCARELNRQPRLQTLNLNDDPLILSKLYSAGYRRMTPGQAYGLGVSRLFILEAKPDELRAAIERASTQALTQGAVEPKRGFSIPAAQPVPTRPPRAARLGSSLIAEVG
jgi:hypothetical protein